MICRDVHAQLLIDDSLENAREVAKAGIPVLLFDLHGAYKWNKLDDGQQLPDKVTRVKSWKEVQAWFPRPKSPLSNQCISRDDQYFQEEESEEEEDDEEKDEEEQLYNYQHQQYHHAHLASSDSDSDEDLNADDDDEMLAKREQEEEEDSHGRTLRRRKLMMMDFSSSEDDDDIDIDHHHHGENMDSDEQDLDLESGHGHPHSNGTTRHISHADLERYRHQHETMYTGEDGMEIEMEVDMESTTTTSTLVDDDMEQGLITTQTTSSSTTIVVSIGPDAQVECPSSELVTETLSTTTIPTSPEAMAVEGLSIKSPPTSASEPRMPSMHEQTDKTNVDMEEVSLA